MTKQEYKDIYDVVGAAMEVYNTLGRGMAEAIYQEALAIEMRRRGMIAEREKQLKLYYKDNLLEKTYYADFCYKGVIIELKSVDDINSDHRAQLFKVGLRAERYLYLQDADDFVLLTHDNYKHYIKYKD